LNENFFKTELINMNIEIWSDKVCPFCYIGKKHFEKALEQFEFKEEVSISWKSFQLDPDFKSEGLNTFEYLSKRKGIDEETVRQMTSNVQQMAQDSGLSFDFEKAIPANTFNAHRLTHLAASKGLGDKAEERLFDAYFVEGRNIGDLDTLTQLGTEIGLEKSEVNELWTNNQFSAEVTDDHNTFIQLGGRGVPFFVIDRKIGISGAQPVSEFLKAIQSARKENMKVSESEASNSCNIDGEC
jgi:predicted DsbA family dithiol-disulfide isomerase